MSDNSTKSNDSNENQKKKDSVENDQQSNSEDNKNTLPEETGDQVDTDQKVDDVKSSKDNTVEKTYQESGEKSADDDTTAENNSKVKEKQNPESDISKEKNEDEVVEEENNNTEATDSKVKVNDDKENVNSEKDTSEDKSEDDAKSKTKTEAKDLSEKLDDKNESDKKPDVESSTSEENEKPTEDKEEITEGKDDSTEDNEESTEDKEDSSEDNEETSGDKEKSTEDKDDSSDDSHHKEIDDANAEDSEDEGNSSRHDIELKDYDAMAMNELVIEIEKLLKKEKVQAIRDHVTQIKIAFDKKFNEIIDEKKEQFIEEGGNVIDFHYSSPVKTKFNRIYFEYREKRDAYYKNLKKNLNDNLKNRLSLIEELKSMIGTGRDMKANFKQFKDLQEQWKNAGPVPRSEYSQLWNNYHHHVERFYDFLHLDREFRDLDFQHNLDQKLKIISRAEELVEEKNINRAFRELQLLHKMWKEELGPVAKEYRDEIWDKFSEATKQIHENRRAHFEELDNEREKHLDVKLDIVEQIKKLAETEIKSHKQAQKNIKILNELRELFFKAGKVPQKDNERVWKSFKENVRQFNRAKNAFYKGLKQEQNDNLEKKLELIKIAEDNKDSDDFETTTALMKKIQADWKKIGFVPRKHSDNIWKKFKEACNSYFDRFHAHKNEENQEEFEAFNAKKDFLDKVKAYEPKDNKKEDLQAVKDFVEKWKSFGLVPRQKRYIEGKFNKALDQIFKNMKIDKTEAELIKYENRIQGLEESNDNDKLYKEEQFLRTKISDTNSKINQFENNLQFFSQSDKESPLVKEVYDNIGKLKDELDMWKTKLQKIKSI
jgi:hypothetical protein